MEKNVLVDIAAAVKRDFVGDASELPLLMAEAIVAAQAVRGDVRRIKRVRVEAEEQFQKQLDTFDARLARVRAACKHESTTYYGDAAGGSDSYTSCNICGAEL